MKRFAQLFPLAILFLALARPADATVTLVFQAEDLLQGGNGSSNVAANSLVLVVADTGNVGFGTLPTGNISVGSKFGTNFDNQIIGQLSVSAGSFLTNNENVLNAELGGNTGTSFFGDWTQNDPLAIYWIPSLTAGDTNVGLGVSYGMYTNATDSSGTGGSPAWITPGDSGSQTFFFSTTGLFGQITDPASAGYASSTTVVPEPATFGLLAGVCSLGYTIYRRRKQVA